LKTENNRKDAYNFSCPSSAGAVVFGVYLSAQAAYRLDMKEARNPPLCVAAKISD